MIVRRWFFVAQTWHLRYIPAEAPCWKGEVQIGRLVWGWEKETA
jgi:hypothetical protein